MDNVKLLPLQQTNKSEAKFPPIHPIKSRAQLSVMSHHKNIFFWPSPTKTKEGGGLMGNPRASTKRSLRCFGFTFGLSFFVPNQVIFVPKLKWKDFQLFGLSG